MYIYGPKKMTREKKLVIFPTTNQGFCLKKFFFLSFQKSLFQSQVRSIKSYRFLSFTQQILMCNLNQIVGIVLLLLLLLYFSSTMWSCVWMCTTTSSLSLAKFLDSFYCVCLVNQIDRFSFIHSFFFFYLFYHHQSIVWSFFLHLKFHFLIIISACFFSCF